MKDEEAKKIINDKLNFFLEKLYDVTTTKGNFRCVSGDHADNDPSMSIYLDREGKSHAKCFACNAHYDSIDLIARKYNLNVSNKDDFKKAIEIGCEMLGIELDSYTPSAQYDFKNFADHHPAATPTDTKVNTSVYPVKDEKFPIEPCENFNSEVEFAHNNLMNNKDALKHFSDRGLSLDTIKKYKLGYAPKGARNLLNEYPSLVEKMPSAPYPYVLPVINSIGIVNYLVFEIAVRNEKSPKYIKPSNIDGLIFNERYLYQRVTEPVFVTEGIYDALSVEEVGYKAIALMGVGYNRLLQFCKAFRHYTLILSLDNDKAGTETIKKLSEELKNIGIKHIIRQSLKKDFNEDLIDDRKTFSDLLQSAVADAKKVESESEIRYRNETCLVNYFEEFEQVRLKNQNKSYIPTGFNSLDSLLDGGLFSGLYIIGAISSLGKTTLCLQMLDNIAKSGTDVLIFSLEMAKSELLAKSISRLTFTKSSKQRNIVVSGRTTRDVLTNKQSHDQVAKSISDAIDTYKNEYSKHVYILEGVGNYDVKEIRKGIETHINMTGNKPVVLIDYLQVIQPYDNKVVSDKQNTDKTVLELKRISREFDITVLVISSFNRENYYQSVSLTSFKESGSIEYSSDVLIGLQYSIDLKATREPDKKKEALKNHIEKVRSDAKDGKPIEIQVKILKNRNGSIGNTNLEFYPKYNSFIDSVFDDESDDESYFEDLDLKISKKL